MVKSEEVYNLKHVKKITDDFLAFYETKIEGKGYTIPEVVSSVFSVIAAKIHIKLEEK